MERGAWRATFHGVTKSQARPQQGWRGLKEHGPEARAVWRVRSVWLRKLGSGGSHFLEGHEGTLQPSRQGPGVQPPSTASGLLTPGG